MSDIIKEGDNQVKERRKIGRWIFIGFLTLAFFGTILQIRSCNKNRDSEEQTLAVEQIRDTVYQYGIPVSEYDMHEGVIGKGDFFSTILTNIGVSQNCIYALTQRCKGVFDLGKIKVGNNYKVFYTQGENPEPHYLVYEKDGASMVVFELKGDMCVEVIEKQFERVKKVAEVTINSALWIDVEAAGVSPLLALKLADIYQWSIDFFGLRKGDSFIAAYEELSYEGRVLDIGDVFYARFRHMSHDYEAYNFRMEGSNNLYWDAKGGSLRRAFLKAPLNFTRVSSGFSYARLHPVTRVVKPHTGVDYAAPTGTPVMSIGDGVVTERGYKGGGGNTVKIRHNSVYTSAYLHLSRYAKDLKVGSRVKQGEVIGYVGSTGVSTGPHLDFRVWKNGTPINPLKMESPSDEPIKKEYIPAFNKRKEYSMWQLDSLLARQWLEDRGIM